VSWPLAKLGDHIEILSGFAFKSELFNSSGEGLPLVRIRDVVPSTSETYYSGEYSDEFLLSDGDLLVGMDGDFNRERWKGGKALLNQRVCKITSNKRSLDQSYLYHFLPKALEKIHAETPAVTVKHLSVKGIRAIEIPLPPLAEQKRIATILDKADAIRRKRQQAIQLADDFLRAVFLDMFGDPVTNTKGWEVKTLNDVCKKITDGTHHSPSIVNSGVPYITAKHLKKTGLQFFENPWFISEEDHRAIFSRCDPEIGDVLYIKDGATTGLAAINNYDFEFSMLSSLALLKPDRKKILPEFLVMFLNDPATKRVMIANMAGAAITRLTLAKIKSVLVPAPPIEMQQQFTDIYLKVLATALKISIAVDASSEAFDAISQKAFSGEL